MKTQLGISLTDGASELLEMIALPHQNRKPMRIRNMTEYLRAKSEERELREKGLIRDGIGNALVTGPAATPVLKEAKSREEFKALVEKWTQPSKGLVATEKGMRWIAEPFGADRDDVLHVMQCMVADRDPA